MSVDITCLKPSDFAKHFPSDSVARKMEVEQRAYTIMHTLVELGNVWRRLTWAEYQSERLKHGAGVDDEMMFDKVVDYTANVIGAATFAPAWAQVAGVPRNF